MWNLGRLSKRTKLTIVQWLWICVCQKKSSFAFAFQFASLLKDTQNQDHKGMASGSPQKGLASSLKISLCSLDALTASRFCLEKWGQTIFKFWIAMSSIFTPWSAPSQREQRCSLVIVFPFSDKNLIELKTSPSDRSDCSYSWTCLSNWRANNRYFSGTNKNQAFFTLWQTWAFCCWLHILFLDLNWENPELESTRPRAGAGVASRKSNPTPASSIRTLIFPPVTNIRVWLIGHKIDTAYKVSQGRNIELYPALLRQN